MIIGRQRMGAGSLLLLLLVLVSLLYLYFPYLQTLVADWGSDDNYSHGYFIPLITLYMIYSQKDSLAASPLKGSILGLPILALGLVMLITGKIGSEFFVQRLSLIVTLLGGVLFLYGSNYFKKLSVPILYLIFMIPLPAIIWNKIAFPLQLFGSYLTEQVIYIIGIPVFREGNVLHLSETTLEVVAACSGLRSLVTLFGLSGALSYFSNLSLLNKWILFFAAAPIAVFANIVRLTTTAILASIYGSEVAHGFLHEFSGVLIFVLGLSMLVGVNSILRKIS